jgi:hypothetical protein
MGWWWLLGNNVASVVLIQGYIKTRQMTDELASRNLKAKRLNGVSRVDSKVRFQEQKEYICKPSNSQE